MALAFRPTSPLSRALGLRAGALRSLAMSALVLVAGGILVGAVAAFDPLLALGLIAAAALGIAVVQRPAVGALVLVALVPVTTGLRPGLPVPGARLSEVLIGAVGGLMVVSQHRRDSVRWRTLDWLALTYALLGLVLGVSNSLLRQNPISGEGWGLIFGPLQFFLLYRAVALGLRRPEDRRRAIQLVLFLSIPVSVLAVLQQERLFGVQPWIESVTQAGVFQSWGFLTSPRATSIFAGWHPFAGYLTIVLLLTVGVLASSDHGKRVVRPRWLGVIGLLALVALLYSETFTAMLGVVGGAFIIAWFHRSTKLLGWLLAGAAVLALAAAFFLGHRLESQLEADEDSVVPQTISYRIDVWGEQYVPVLRDYWATGYGPALPDTIEWQSTESQYLTLVLRGGLPLLLVYGALMAAMGVRANRLRSHADPTIRAVAPVVLTAVIVLVPMNALFPYFTASGLAQIFWVLVGVLVSVRRDARPDGDGDPAVGAASPGASGSGRRELLPA